MRGDRLIIKDYHREAARGVMELLDGDALDPGGRYVMTVAGESGAGKSEIAAVLAELFEARGIGSVILQQDDYFVYPPKTNAEMRWRNIGHVGISEVRLDLLDRHLEEYIGGAGRIEKPLVIFEEDRIDSEQIELDGIGALVVEGTYTTALTYVHRRIFIDRTYIDTRDARSERAREAQDDFLERVLEIEHGIISAHKREADIIITRDYEARKAHGEDIEH
ncbi:MAG: hypothetical protein JSV33_09700 [bacterium]|nr:MAG: hypothetical protein JSV33_09700 [bacterium]